MSLYRQLLSYGVAIGELLVESADRLHRALHEAQTSKALLQQQLEQQRLVMEMSQQIQRSLNLPEILQTTVDEVRQFLHVDRVIIFRFTPDWGGSITVESVVDESLAILPFEIYDPCIGEQYVAPFQHGLVTAKSDIYNSGISSCHIQFLERFQVKANLVVPILKHDQLWGLLAAHHCTSTREWPESEIELLQQIAAQVSIALQQSALFEQVQTELNERKQAEAALRESQVQLQRQLAEIEALYQSAPIGLNVLDTNLRFVRINQRLAEINGLPIEAHIGRTIHELLPNLADTAEQLLRPILATGEPLFNIEITGETPAQPGVQRTWLESFLPLKDGDRVIGVSTVCQEITERKQAEQALAKELFRIQTLFNTTFDGIFILDRHGKILDANPRFVEMLGYTSTEITQLTVFDLDAQFTRAEIQQLLDDSINLQKGVFETRHRRQDGSIYDVEISFNVVEWEEEILRFSVCRDITERKRSEADRKQTQISLQQLNAKLEQRIAERTADLSDINDRLRRTLEEQQRAKQEIEDLYNAAPCGYHSLDAEGRFVRINHTELNWLGYTREELLHRRKLVELLTPDSQVVFSQEFPQLKQRGWVNNLELQMIRKDGNTRWFNLNATVIRDEAGNFVMTRSTLFDISDRKQIEAERQHVELALRDSEEKFRQLAENIEAVFWIRDGQKHQVLYVSPAYETIWQQSCESLYHNFANWIDSIDLEDRPRVATAALQLTTGGHYDQEYRIRRPDGSLRWIRDRASSIKNVNGDVVRIAGLAEDITNRKLAEVALQQQTKQEQLRWKITQAIRQSLDLSAILHTAVEQVRQTLQVDRVAVYRFQPNWSGNFIAESVGDHWVKLVDGTIQKIWQDTYLQETQGGRFQNHQTFVVADIHTAGLQPCHIELLEQFQAKAYVVAPIFSGTTLWGLLAIYQNATAHAWQAWEVELLQQIASQLSIAIQQAELYRQLQIELQERQQATAIIREAERRWRSLLNNVQLLVVGLDQFGTVNYVNPFFLALTGYTEMEVLGKDWISTFLLPSYQPTAQQVFLGVIQQNAHPYHQNFILTKTGEERFIAWNNTQLQDSQGNVIGTVSIGEDITERQRVEKMKNEFISIVSHELRTPLTSIRGSLGLLATGVMDDELDEMKHMIEIAAIDTERLVRLVNDVLDLEKLESGKVSLIREWCNAAELMQQSLEVMQSSAQEAGVQLVVHPLSVQIWVAADRIMQTFTNLLSNAIKFSPPGSTVTLTAELLSSPPLSHIRFSIHDQGRGIPADKLETIFGRFQQVDASDSRDKGGTGLGLAICQSIVQQHDGRIWVESCWQQGSTFFFTLPLPSK